MASIKTLKSRIRSVGSTRQITKAMQLVAASKMRRAQEADKASAPYTRAASELLAYLAAQGATDEHPLFKRRNVAARLLIVIAADKGLAGAYNSNITKAYIGQLEADKASSVATKTLVIGRRAAQFVSRLKGVDVVGVYEDLPDKPAGRELRSILDTALDMFESGEVDAVDVIFTEFRSSISQVAITRRLLPAGFEFAIDDMQEHEAKYEPSIPEVINGVAYRLVGAQLFQALLDARASEHSMRMLAMKNATDNANDLIDDLTLAMNKVRQAAITQELAEISGGVEALNE